MAPKEHLTTFGDIFGVTSGDGVLLAYGKSGPRMPLILLPCTYQPHTTKQNVSSAEDENPLFYWNPTTFTCF